MQSDTDHQRNQVDLEFLQNVLNKLGVKSELFQLPEPEKLHILSAPLDGECLLQLMYIPIGEVMTETNLLQFYGTHTPVLEATPEVLQFIQFINTQSPLGQFAFTEDSRLYNRYIYALHRFSVPNEEVFGEVVELFATSLMRYAEVVTKLSAGKISLEEAVQVVTS